ncbi:hypothetical protein [Anthocerotibacter panamensis]|uniref:hypothetical protein n=1 Tax=Anthocerotibacter panamensis TaxID=2857077 RepID=UPI001C405BF7|nr:hypothetical protein [Anthocerotibacter panamensis]
MLKVVYKVDSFCQKLEGKAQAPIKYLRCDLCEAEIELIPTGRIKVEVPAKPGDPDGRYPLYQISGLVDEKGVEHGYVCPHCATLDTEGIQRKLIRRLERSLEPFEEQVRRGEYTSIPNHVFWDLDAVLEMLSQSLPTPKRPRSRKCPALSMEAPRHE